MEITKIMQAIAVGTFILIIAIISIIKVSKNGRTYEVKGEAIRKLDLKRKTVD